MSGKITDAVRLRRELRLVGSLVGCSSRSNQQSQAASGRLPLLLSPEELKLLRNELGEDAVTIQADQEGALEEGNEFLTLSILIPWH